MNKGYLKSLLNYLLNVYDIREKINRLKDKRANPKITTAAIAFSVLMGFMIKIRSFNQLDDYLEHGDFNKLAPKRTKLLRIDTVKDSLKSIELKPLKLMSNSIIKTSTDNKLFRNGTIDNYKVAAFDGVELFESTNKSCPGCLTRVINGTPHYFHRCVVAAYVGRDPHIIIGYEMLKPRQDSANKDEGELTSAKRLLSDLCSQYRHFADIIVYDALACNAPWIMLLVPLV